MLPEPQRRRNQGPSDDVQGWADDLRLRLLEERLYDADSLALVLDVRADPFDYLRGRFSGCGQRVDEDGEVITAVYWSCFRQGCDDARYVYTLQQAIVQRQNAADAACQAAVRQGRRILQETWDAIHVQPKYLATGMWPSEEFDALRWRLAAQTEKLLEYPPPTIAILRRSWSVEPKRPAAKPQVPSPFEQAARAGNLEASTLAAISAPGPTAPPRARSRLPKEHGTRARRGSAGRSRWIGNMTAARRPVSDRLAEDQPEL